MKNIAVVTGTRAEYGLLKPLIKAIDESKDLNLQLLVTGMHLMPEFGNTYKQIEKDGFKIDVKVNDGLSGDSSEEITTAIGQAMIGFAEVINNLKPNVLVLLGDRTELLAAATAAIIANIPIAHIHGGETTEGAYDEFIRHAITKMSYLHFASCEVYCNRIIQMGEHPSRVYNVGAIGIDSIKSIQLLDRKEFEESISKKLTQITILITFHPVTNENNTSESHFGELLDAIDSLKDTTLIFTKPNADKGGKIIIEMIDAYVEQNHKKAVQFDSLGQLRYLSALKHIDVIVGNSSSGIFEAPLFNTPTVNIGNRQKGRLMPDSVINCPPNKKAIIDAIALSLSDGFKAKIENQSNPYGNGIATPQIVKILTETGFKGTQKAFYDLSLNKKR